MSSQACAEDLNSPFLAMFDLADLSHQHAANLQALLQEGAKAWQFISYGGKDETS